MAQTLACTDGGVPRAVAPRLDTLDVLDLQTRNADPLGRPAAAVEWLGNLAVVDPLSRNVKVFDRNGQLRETLGRGGEGPGEFLDPQSAVAMDDGDLAVLDRGQRKVVFFDRTGSYSTQFVLDVLPSGDMALSLSGGSLVVAGRRLVTDGKLDTENRNSLHEFTLLGEHVRSFAPRPTPRHPLEASSMNAWVTLVGPHIASGLMSDRVIAEYLDTLRVAVTTISEVAPTPWGEVPESFAEGQEWLSDNWTALMGLESIDGMVFGHFMSGSRREGTDQHWYAVLDRNESYTYHQAGQGHRVLATWNGQIVEVLLSETGAPRVQFLGLH